MFSRPKKVFSCNALRALVMERLFGNLWQASWMSAFAPSSCARARRSRDWPIRVPRAALATSTICRNSQMSVAKYMYYTMTLNRNCEQKYLLIAHVISDHLQQRGDATTFHHLLFNLHIPALTLRSAHEIPQCAAGTAL